MSLSFGFNKHMTSKEATDKLVEAVRNSDFKRVTKLVETGLIDPNINLTEVPRPKNCQARGTNLDGPILTLAVELGEYDLAKALIQQGANVNCGDVHSFSTPLQRASYEDNPRILSLLLEAGATAGINDALRMANDYAYRDVKEIITETIEKRNAPKPAGYGYSKKLSIS